MADTFAGYEPEAAAILPPDVVDFIAGGSGSELTLRRNRAALDAVTITPRALAGIGEPSTTADKSTSMPVAVAPMAYQRLVHPEGELALARAAAHARVPYVISTLSSFPLEKIAGVGGVTWFQLYWLRDRGMVESLVARAVDAGCTALMLTVDVPAMGRRLRDVRNSFRLPAEVVAANLVESARVPLEPGVPERCRPTGTVPPAEAHTAISGVSAVAAHTASAFEPAVGWAELEWLRDRCPVPLWIKGILDPRDAQRAVTLGVDGLVVSNHGGRQFDGAPASIDALEPIVAAVDRPVLLDSGIRSGLDVLRALALGASGVLVGRPLLWALAAGAASRAFELLRAELLDAMLLAGCADPAAAAELATGRVRWPISS